MKYFRLKFVNGSFKIVSGKNSLEVIKKYDLATKQHINTRIIQLEGEQKSIALANWNKQF